MMPEPQPQPAAEPEPGPARCCAFEARDNYEFEDYASHCFAHMARPSLIPPDARTPRRAGIEWRHYYRAVCMARPHEEPYHSGQAEP